MDRITKLREFLALNPADNFIQHALALEYVKLGEDSKAKTIFESLLERDPTYIGSYYHLAQLLERLDEKKAALECYEKGMIAAREAGDQHAYNELQAAYENLID